MSRLYSMSKNTAVPNDIVAMIWYPDSWQWEKRYKWNKTEVQYAELFSAGAVAKLCSFRKINRCGKSLCCQSFTVPSWRIMNKWSFISPMGTILYEGPLFLSSLDRTSKNNKRMHLLSYSSGGHCVAFVSLALSHSFKFCPDSNLRISLSYSRKHICASSMWSCR